MSILPNKVFFQGLGGAGQRHLRIFRGLLPNAEFFAFRRTLSTPLLNSDFTVDSHNNLKDKYNLRVVSNIDEAWESNPELTIISLPSSMQAAATVQTANK